ETVDCTNRFEQLHERALRVAACSAHSLCAELRILRSFFQSIGQNVRYCARNARATRYRRKFVAAIEIHDLAEQRDFLYSLRDERANFGDDFRNGAAALSASRAGHNAKGAMHVASLHDRHERRRLFRREELIPNGRLRTDFFFYIDDRKTRIIHSIQAALSDSG